MLSEFSSSGTGIPPRRNLQKIRSVGGRWRSLFLSVSLLLLSLSLLPASLVPSAADVQSPAAGPASPSPKPLVLEVVDDRASELVSIRAGRISFKRVLNEISERAHLKLASRNEEFLRDQAS